MIHHPLADRAQRDIGVLTLWNQRFLFCCCFSWCCRAANADY
jgi:hypothetical protein